MRSNAESQLLRAVLIHLGSRPDVLAYRVHVGPMINPRTGAIFAKSSVPSGHPDLIAIVRGQFFGLEIKSPDGRQLPNQIAFQRAVERAGGVYVILREIGDLPLALK